MNLPSSWMPLGNNTGVSSAARRWSLPALSGLLLALAFPCHPDNPLAFLYHGVWALVAMVPLLTALAHQTPRSAFYTGWLTGTVWSLLSLYWVAHTQGGGPAVVGGTLLMSLYLGLYTGAFTACISWLARPWRRGALFLSPVIWTSLEYLQSLGELGFPWLLLGNSVATFTDLIQYAEYTGVYGVSFWVVVINALLFLLISESRPTKGAVAIALAVALTAPLSYSAYVLTTARDAADSIRVGLVQNNMGREKWAPGGLERSLARLSALSRRAAVDEPELIVWPETAVPCYLDSRPKCRNQLAALVRELRIPLLTGAPDVDAATRQYYNSAFLLSGDPLPLQSYAKMHLVPFGERTPFRDSIPLLRDIDWSVLTGDLGSAEFTPGDSQTLFQHDKGPFAVLICFESAFPDLVRRGVRAGARFLVIITNDSWFGRTSGPYQHAQLSILRAVENRTAIARCATSGITLFIDPFGRISQPTGLYEEAVRVGDLALGYEQTFYTRYGDVFAGGCLVMTVAALAACGFRRRRHLDPTARADD